MQPFYYNLYEQNYYEMALNEAVELFSSFPQEKKELVYDKIKAKYGSENVENDVPPQIYKEQVFSCILPFLETQKAIELISLGLRNRLYKTIPNFQHIDYELDFSIAFFKYLKLIPFIDFGDFKYTLNGYGFSNKQFKDIFEVEKYFFIKKLQVFYEEYNCDFQYIKSIIKKYKTNAKSIVYNVSYINGSYPANKQKNSKYGAEREDIERYKSMINNILQENILSIDISDDDFGKCLMSYIDDRKLAIYHHKIDANEHYKIAQQDLRIILNNYNKNIQQLTNMKIEITLKAGTLHIELDRFTFGIRVFLAVLLSLVGLYWFLTFF